MSRDYVERIALQLKGTEDFPGFDIYSCARRVGGRWQAGVIARIPGATPTPDDAPETTWYEVYERSSYKALKTIEKKMTLDIDGDDLVLKVDAKESIE